MFMRLIRIGRGQFNPEKWTQAISLHLRTNEKPVEVDSCVGGSYIDIRPAVESHQRYENTRNLSAGGINLAPYASWI